MQKGKIPIILITLFHFRVDWCSKNNYQKSFNKSHYCLRYRKIYMTDSNVYLFQVIFYNAYF